MKLFRSFPHQYSISKVKCLALGMASTFFLLILGHLIGHVNASVANSYEQIIYETSAILNDVIIIDHMTGALYVNGSIDADIPVCRVIR